MSAIKEIMLDIEDVISAVTSEAMPACRSITKSPYSSPTDRVQEEGWILSFQPDDSSIKPIGLAILLTVEGLVLLVGTDGKKAFYSELFPHNEIPKDDIAFLIGQRLR